MVQLQCPVYYMYGLDYLNLCNSFKNRLQNAKDFLLLPALLKFSLGSAHLNHCLFLAYKTFIFKAPLAQ